MAATAVFPPLEAPVPTGEALSAARAAWDGAAVAEGEDPATARLAAALATCAACHALR